MPYKTWANNDVPSGADFNNMMADAVMGYVATFETTASTTYGDLATVGPSATISLVNGQGILIMAVARNENDTAGANGAAFSFAVSGAGSLGASDDYCGDVGGIGAGASATCTAIYWFVAGATGSYTVTMKYKRTNAGTAGFRRRRVIIKKF